MGEGTCAALANIRGLSSRGRPRNPWELYVRIVLAPATEGGDHVRFPNSCEARVREMHVPSPVDCGRGLEKMCANGIAEMRGRGHVYKVQRHIAVEIIFRMVYP